jgi:serine/threonine-protein kinase
MTTSPPPEIAPDNLERLGRYVLLEKIAEGGMAEVFRAATIGSAGFNKMLAIKRILPHLARDPDFGAMFIDEAKIAALLNHPNILQVLDLGAHKGQHFIVMEYIAGRPLNKLLAVSVSRKLKLPHAMCCYLVLQALQGLSYAHQKRDGRGQPLNIIHRDISPHNIMVGFDGSVKLADFGIAKAATRSTQTATGSIKGKPAYMAPEQVAVGAVLDQRLDVYAMGVVLHEMLSMARMRPGKSDVEMIMEVAKGDFPRFEDRGVEVPQAVQDVVYRALAKDLTQRWASSEDMRLALQDAVRGLHWHWDDVQTQVLMRDLFPTDIADEEGAQEKYITLIEKLSQADVDAIKDVFNDVVASRTDIKTPLSAADLQVIQNNRWRVPAAVGVVALAAVVAGTFALRQPEAHLMVTTTPAGATVVINGRTQPGVTPLTLDHLHPGPTQVAVELRDHAPARQSVELMEGDAPNVVTLSLKALNRTVTLQSSPPGATFDVNGVSLGTAPVKARLAAGGRAVIKATLPGRAPVEQNVLVDDVADPLVVTLPEPRRDPTPPKENRPEKNAPPARGNGTLTLVSKPWARVFIDGKDTGRFTPLNQWSLTSGSHQIMLRNDQQDLTLKFSVKVGAGQDTKVSKELR